MTLLFTDPVFLKHDTGQHPETADRLRAIDMMLDQTGLRSRCTPGRFSPLDAVQLQDVHTRRVVDRVREVAGTGGGRLAVDTLVSAASYDVALAATGECFAAGDSVMAD